MWSPSPSDYITAEQRAAEEQQHRLATYSSAIQGMLDAKAQERGYDGMLAAVTYLDDPNPAYAAEAAALKVWRSVVWTYALAALADVQAGEREAPTVDGFLGEVTAACPFSWPG